MGSEKGGKSSSASALKVRLRLTLLNRSQKRWIVHDEVNHWHEEGRRQDLSVADIFVFISLSLS